MSNISRLILTSFFIIIFCTGILVLGLESKTYLQTLFELREQMKDEELYEQAGVTDLSIVSRSELIADLCHTLDYDITIDRVYINRSTHSPEHIKEYGINSSKYRRVYDYSEQGGLAMIHYTKIP